MILVVVRLEKAGDFNEKTAIAVCLWIVQLK